jgi:SM-20-related protein
MAGLDWGVIDAARVARTPFDHVALDQVLEGGCAAAIPGEFPDIRNSGSFSLADAPPGRALVGLIDDLLSERFRRRMETLFEVDLSDRPTLVTLRGQCSPRDGTIHTDSKSKVLSLLLYLNADWPTPEGRLRLLRNGASLEDVAVEAPATLGSLVIFRRSDRSWHGHTPFSGQRRVLQLNYLQSARASVVGSIRHRVSALMKQHVAG